MAGTSTVTETNFDDLPLLYRGKVRDVYQPSESELLLVATDRLSAFDCILPTPIRLKGSVLTSLSVFWFGKLSSARNNHLITADFDQMPEPARRHEELRGRSMLVKKTKVFPVECVVRGYLEGSGWKDYQATGEICSHRLRRSSPLVSRRQRCRRATCWSCSPSCRRRIASCCAACATRRTSTRSI